MCDHTNEYSNVTANAGVNGQPLPTPVPPVVPFPVPADWWRCLRLTGISGSYKCYADDFIITKPGLDLRIDVDSRYANSPVLNRVSGDFFSSKLVLGIPASRPKYITTYNHSWIIESPAVSWTRCTCIIKGRVKFWKGTHPPTDALIEVDWSGSKTLVTAKFITSASTTIFHGERISDCFRAMNLEVDVCRSVNAEPILPEYDTHAHPTRPVDLPKRTLSLTEAYREAGVCVTLRAGRSVIDDSAAQFNTWSVGELHDAMETNFSQISSGWPKWEMWGVLVSRFDSAGTAGIMFDAAAAYGGAGEAPDRQGFAVARNHSWFNNLVTGAPTTPAQADAMRQYLYTWVHEAGHAFNFLHSWNKGRPNSLSWMNYPHQVPGFWDNFRMRFDDEELIHMRHGDRLSVIMGGDAWASGGHLDAPELAFVSELNGDSPLEVTLKAKEYFDFLEPVKVELRLRNTLDGVPLEVDTRLQPEHGRVAFLVQRPDGRVVDYDSIFCAVGEAQTTWLKGAKSGQTGEDRYSESIALNYGKEGFMFDRPGDYRVKAFYQAPDGFVYPSNVIRVRIGRPFTREEDRLAQDYFSQAVGLILALNETRSPHLKSGRDALEDAQDRLKGTAAATQIATVLAAPLVRPFYRIVENKDKTAKTVKQAVKSDPDATIALTNPALAQYKKDKAKTGNLGYHQLVRLRAGALKEAGKLKQAKDELNTLKNDLAQRQVNASVLNEITAFEAAL